MAIVRTLAKHWGHGLTQLRSLETKCVFIRRSIDGACSRCAQIQRQATHRNYAAAAFGALPASKDRGARLSGDSASEKSVSRTDFSAEQFRTEQFGTEQFFGG